MFHGMKPGRKHLATDAIQDQTLSNHLHVHMSKWMVAWGSYVVQRRAAVWLRWPALSFVFSYTLECSVHTCVYVCMLIGTFSTPETMVLAGYLWCIPGIQSIEDINWWVRNVRILIYELGIFVMRWSQLHVRAHTHTHTHSDTHTQWSYAIHQSDSSGSKITSYKVSITYNPHPLTLHTSIREEDKVSTLLGRSANYIYRHHCPQPQILQGH